MFDAATSSQKPVLEGIFGKQLEEINLSKHQVDGLDLFKINGTLSTSLIATGGPKNRFWLNPEYKWRIEGNHLIIERK